MDEVPAEQHVDEDDETAFLNFEGKDKEKAADGDIEAFEDTDYSENNQKLNRVKQFTFIQE